jgi:hypothetical protein
VRDVALEVGGRKLLELVLGQVLVVLGGHRNAGYDVPVQNRLKMTTIFLSNLKNYKPKPKRDSISRSVTPRADTSPGHIKF